MTTNDDPDVRRETIAYDAAGIRLTPDLPPRPVNTPPRAQETAPRAVDQLREALTRDLNALRAAASRGPVSSREIFQMTDPMMDRLSRAAPPTPAETAGDALREHLKWYADTFCELGNAHECCGRMSEDDCSGCRARAALAAAPQPAPVDPLRAALDLILANINTKSECACMGPRFGEPLCPCAMTHAARDRLLQMRAALAAAPQAAPVDPLREALIAVIEQGFQDARHMETGRPREAIADALLAAGLRLPGAVQPDETPAWAVVGKDGEISLVYLGENRREIAELIAEVEGKVAVRVAIRIVEDEA